MKIRRTSDRDFDAFFRDLRLRGRVFDEDLLAEVKGIVTDVATRGDDALFALTARFDGYTPTAETVQAAPAEWSAAAAEVAAADLGLLELAAGRIERFHRQQRIDSYCAEDEPGITWGQRILPLERIGIYAPGGLAAYPSTVLMAAIPARIAGVKEILLVSPAREGRLNPLIAAAARVAGVTRIFKIGGAQAVAALAYGTASIPAVDKIVGPGNAYVAAAKMLVFGQCAIDMIAGPSEVLIIADGSQNPAVCAADLLSQAEHDPLASALLLTPDDAYARRVTAEVERQLPTLSRREIAARSWSDYGAAVVTKDLAEAVALANRFAPEHLELMVDDPQALLPGIVNAGAVFLGGCTPEAVGDYLAGPNHILPTGGTARFASPLGVYDYVKRMSVLSFSREALLKYGRQAARLADLEGLEGHGKSITRRLDADPGNP
jgi:histidinol dehydrogenase